MTHRFSRVGFHAIPTPGFGGEVWNLETAVRSGVAVDRAAEYLLVEVQSLEDNATFAMTQVSTDNMSLMTQVKVFKGTNRLVLPVLQYCSSLFIEPQPWLILKGIDAAISDDPSEFIPCVSAEVYQHDRLVRTPTIGQYEFRTRFETMSPTLQPERDCSAALVASKPTKFAGSNITGHWHGRMRMQMAEKSSLFFILPPSALLSVSLERKDALASANFFTIL